MNKVVLFLISLWALILCCACTTEDIIPEITVSQGTVDYFEEPMIFPCEGGSKILNFSTNTKWTLVASSAHSSAGWCTTSQSEGSAGTFNIAVIAAENAAYEDRSMVFTLTAGTLTKSIVIRQSQKNAFLMSPDRIEISNEGGNVDVAVETNLPFKVEIPEKYHSWIDYGSNSKAMTRETISLIIAKSEEYEKREGEVLIKTAESTYSIHIYQRGAAILVLSQNEYVLGSEGGSITININSNFNYIADIPNTGWIIQKEKTRSVSSSSMTLEIAPNSTYEDREAVIVFRDSNSDKKESVTIKQRQKDAIIIENDKIELSQDGGTFEVKTNSNVSFSIEIPSFCSDWLSVENAPSTRSMTKSTQTFKATMNTEYDKREGEIRFISGDIIETIKVYQSGGAIILLSKDSYELEGRATTLSIDLKSNIAYFVTTSDSWISEVETRAVSSSKKIFSIDANKAGKERNGTITFTSSDNTKKATVTITQASIISAKELNIAFSNTSGTIGGSLYIGKNYGFSVSVTPSNATVDYEWAVDDSRIASISGTGSNVTINTKDYGKTNITVTEKNSGISKSYAFGTCVTNFQFNETSRDTKFGYPVVTIALGDKHQLRYSCSPSNATKVFSSLSPFNIKEIMPGTNVYAIVDKASTVDIDENGVITAKKVGTTILESNNGYGVYKSGTNEGVFINVVEEISPYGTIGGHGYVDLGLPSGKLWATESFGAWTSTDYGSYYMWSDTQRVSSSWGSKWSTPTIYEFEEFLSNCSHTWTSVDGVAGYQFTGNNGATLFLPAAGFKNYVEGYGFSSASSKGKWALYWTSSSSSYSWEGQGFAFAFQGTATGASTNNTYNITILAAPIRPISR